MDFGAIAETIFGFVMLGFMIFITFGIFFGLVNDSKTPRRRRRQSARTYRKMYEVRDFSYASNPNSKEFLVYFIENKTLNSLKLGVGTSGRVLQFINSHSGPSYETENKNWEVLRIAKFSTSELDFEVGRDNAYEAEKRAHYYWRKVLSLPVHLSDHQIGYSQIEEYGQTRWKLTKGYTETAEIGKVCEQSTWHYVTNSPGFLEESKAFNENPRDLECIYPEHLDYEYPLDYFEKASKKVSHLILKPRKNVEDRFWAKVSKRDDGCWIWEGATLNDRYGYGIFAYKDKNQTAHRVAWQLVKQENVENLILDKLCGTFKCINPDHWGLSSRLKSIDGKKRVSEFICITEGCTNSSRTVTKAGVCEPCNQRAKRKRRKLRKNGSLGEIFS
jgi:hypothetical protein